MAEYEQLMSNIEKDLNQRFPIIAKSIQRVRVEKAADHPLSRSTRNGGVYTSLDSCVCQKEAIPRGYNNIPFIRTEIPKPLKTFIDKSMDSLVKKGMSEEAAKERVMGNMESVMGFDKANGQYVISARPKANAEDNGVTKVLDSLLEQTSIPMWNIGWLTRVIKQPFATSQAKRLVSVESFNNPWADVIGLFQERFEGYGKISTAAKGNVKQNNSNPVSNAADQIVDEVFNLSVDFESDTLEDIKAGQPGNFITGQLKADREKYAMMVLERMQDSLIYYGSNEAGIDGLVDVTTVEMYDETPLINIFNSTSEKKGAEIVMAMNKVIGNFLRKNHYMAREVRINVSEYVFQALTQTVYSDVYNPQSPLAVLTGNFKGQNELDGGLVQVGYSIVSDTMCNPNTPFNPNDYDMMFITVPNIQDAMGEQDSLVIHPELLKQHIVPAVWQRSGLLYTMYKRIGGVIAPIEGTVKVVAGFGYQGA